MARGKKEKRRRFKGGVSRNAAKQARGAQYGHLNLPKGVSVFREDAKTRVSLDIMPYEVTGENHPDRDDEYGIAVPGELWYKRPYWLHRNIGPNNDAIVCPTSIKKKCPICEYRSQQLKDGADWNDESIRALKPSMRNLYVVIPKGHKNYSEDPHIWDISQFLFQEKLNEEIQENEEYETFPDLEEGFTLKIRFSEEQLGNNKFADTSRIDFIDRDEEYDEDILEKIPNLDEVLVVMPYKTIEAAFFGGINHEDVEEEEIDSEDIPDFEDGDEDDDEDENEANETGEEEEVKEEPKKKKAKETKKDSQKQRRTRKKGESKDKCPHGHKFGKDCDEYDECDDCEIWEDCIDTLETLEREKEKKK